MGCNKISVINNTVAHCANYKLVPENELKNKCGIILSKLTASFIVKDNLLITGQNSASSKEAAKELLVILKK